MGALGVLRERLRGRRLYIQAGIVAQAVRQARRAETRVASLKTDRPRRGRALLSYIVDPFLLPPGAPVPDSHTNYWESLDMGRAWLEAGYDLDVIHWTNTTFRPTQPYDVVIDVRHNLERLAPLVGPRCVKVFHCETSHWLYHTSQHHRRLQELKDRRGVAMRPDKIVDPNRGIEVADCATILGNEMTQSTFRFAGRPLYHVPIATLRPYPWPERKDFAASRGRYLWFGSSGLVHKGLDLALEAFAGMPEFHLTVAGPIEGEFAAAYRAELTQAANITATGWVDVNGPRFGEIMDGCAGLVYPTCSEGASGSTVTCMHAGLIPVVSRQCGIDIAPSYGVVLGDVSIDAIRAAVRALADVPPERLREMARGAWEFARATHTREHFGATYRAAVQAIEAEHIAPRRQRGA